MSVPYTRTRSDSAGRVKTKYKQKRTLEDGSTLSTTYRNHSSYPLVRTMTDTVTPGYVTKRRAGDIVMNPCYSLVNEEELPSFTSDGIDHWVYSQYPVPDGRWYKTGTRYEYTATAGHIDFPDAEDKWDLAAQNLYSKATGNVSQLLVTLGELKQTIQLIVGVKKRFCSRLLDLKSKKPGKFGRALNAGGSTWLEARYGWRPFLYELDGLAEAFASLANKSNKLYRSQFQMEYDYSDAYDVNTSTNVYDLTLRNKTTYTDKYKGVILYGLNPDIITEYDKAFGLTAILSTAWELTPWSFVIDRFINIGDVLTYLDNKDLINVHSSCITRTQKWESSIRKSKAKRKNLGGHPDRASRYHPPGSLGHRRTKTEITRRTNLAFPVFPQVDVNIDLPFGIDLFFLVKQLLGR